jgi:hypothetical protein
MKAVPARVSMVRHLFADAIDAGGGGVETHAVAEEEDHVLGFRGVALRCWVAAGGKAAPIITASPAIFLIGVRSL